MIIANAQKYIRPNNAVTEYVERFKKVYDCKTLFLTNTGMSAIVDTIEYFRKQYKHVSVEETSYFEVRLLYNGEYEQLPDILDGCSDAVYFCDSTIDYDIKALSQRVHENGGILIVDNTSDCIYYNNPLKDGADVVVESLTKYVCGHADMTCGLIATNLDCERPLSDYVAMRGECVSEYQGYMAWRGYLTLPVRMERITETTQRICHRLDELGVKYKYIGHGGVILLPNHEQYNMDSLKTFTHCNTFGGVESYWSVTYPYEEPYDFLRLSIGLEPYEDLIQDVERMISA
ncbi:PLP-dependent transferase [Allisonella histaminiformans]|uniref:PLP-dependent transferase n=1 Tax=Allisonella histaminiformans TaxID=209880 RepID=UPI002E7875F5|nr:PLP-dependent transferase [Allisonella histaminiformans]